MKRAQNKLVSNRLALARNKYTMVPLGGEMKNTDEPSSAILGSVMVAAPHEMYCISLTRSGSILHE
jgi:hypothetical protein